jgi:iron complex transport system substrate-binding protein
VRALLALVVVASLATAACGDDTKPTTPAPGASSAATAAKATFPLSFTDSAGTTVTFKEAPKRIISYSPGATETLFAIGAGSQMVAADQFSDYPDAAKALPKVEYSNPSPEPAVAFKPDLVIIATRQEGQAGQFRALGLPVVLLREPETVAGVLTQIRSLGRIAGKADEAERLAAGLQQRIDRVNAAVSSRKDGPLVFYEITPDLYTVSPSSFIGNILSLMKARNVAEGQSSPFPQISAEAVIKANPSVILLADSGDQGGQTIDTVRARPGWSSVTAVKLGRVYTLDGNVFSRPGPRVVDALEQLQPLLYPPQ